VAYTQNKTKARAVDIIIGRRAEYKKYDWSQNARPSQLAPAGQWHIWCIIAGRGFGKTRTGAETVREWVAKNKASRIALVGNTLDDVRKVMIEGESGLLNVHPPGEVKYYPSTNTLKWKNGAIATAYSSDAYQNLRGPQFDAAWVDELAKFNNAQETWDQLMLCMRLGNNPRTIVTTTPRPTKLIKDLLVRTDVVITRGSTYENCANLSSAYLEEIERSYSGTSLCAQEVMGEVLSSHSLWRRDLINIHLGPMPLLRHVVVGVDPAATAHGDETGIVTVGVDMVGNFFVLDDASGNFTPSRWADVVTAQYKIHNARVVVAEVNQGGDMIQAILKEVPVRSVRATRSKAMRAAPIAALYEQGVVFHARHFPELEQQLLDFESCGSPDRVDALVWAICFLQGV
jgi:phage terminase large subunit-like protein